MNLNKQLRILFIVLALFIISIGGVYLKISSSLNNQLLTNELINKIVRSSFEMHVISREYIEKQSLRTKKQWDYSHQSLSVLLLDAQKIVAADNLDLKLKKVSDNRKKLYNLFLRLVRSDNVLSLSEERKKKGLLSQVSIISQQMVSDASLMGKQSLLNVRTSASYFKQVITTLIVSFIIMLLGIVVWVQKIVLSPMLRLKESVRNFSIDTAETVHLPEASGNEVGQLTLSFKAMMDNVIDGQRHLKQLNIDLEDRVDERTQELVFSEQKQRAIASSMSECILTFDDNFVIESINTSGNLMFGYDGDELPWGFLDKLIPEYERSGFYQHINDCISGKGLSLDTRYEMKMLRKDSTQFQAELSINEMNIDEMNIYVAVINDVSQRKKEEELLQKAREQAEQTARDKTEFLSTMSHEIRTPLNGVLGMADLLNNSDLDRDQREMLDTIQDSGQILLGIINNVLDLSKVEAGKMDLEYRPVKLEPLIYSVLLMMAHRAHENSIELYLDYASDCPRSFLGDETRIKQILVNLVSNAIKFTSQGSVTVQVDFKKGETGDRYLYLCVQDTGVGIHKNQQDKLFNLFSQADSSTTRKFGGTGLGLSICKRLTTLMNGRIGVESTYGVGSRFWLELPLQSITEEGERDFDKLKGLHVLAVSDDEHQRNILEKQLDCLDLRSTTMAYLSSLSSVLMDAQIAGDGYQLLMIDERAGEDGLDILVQDIYKHPELNELKIIILASLGTCDPKAFVHVVSCYTKPTSIDSLYKCLLTTCLSGDAEQDSVADEDLITFDARVLLAEDVVVNQKVAIAMLNKMGVTVEIANNGQQAIDMWQAGKYDLIFMDCQMPEMDGYEASHYIREHEEDEHITIVAMTANALLSDRNRCLEAGMDDYLTKPYSSDDLKRVLEKWINNLRVVTHQETDMILASDSPVEEKGVNNNASTVIDLAILGQLKEMMGDAFGELIPVFIDQMDEYMQDILKSFDTGDKEIVRRIAHSMKSSCYNMGAVNLSERSRTLEQAIDDQGLSADLKDEIYLIMDEYKQVKQVLLDYS